MKKHLAAFMLLIIAATLFLIMMGSEDAADMKREFVKMAPWLIFIYIIASTGLNKYKGGSSVSKIIGPCVMFIILMMCVLSAQNRRSIPLPSSALTGRILFGLAFADILLGFYCPWGRSRAQNRDEFK